IPVRVIDRCTRTLLLRSFFFQAEDGIRDFHVTGVQTCALPIWLDAWIYSKPHGGKQGGDVHYVSSCAAGMLTRLLVADVRGHGDAAADTALALRQLMRRYINYYDQGRFVASMNRTFARHATDGAFATAIVTSFVATTGVLRVSNAGHPPPLLYRVRDRRWVYLEPPRRSP